MDNQYDSEEVVSIMAATLVTVGAITRKGTTWTFTEKLNVPDLDTTQTWNTPQDVAKALLPVIEEDPQSILTKAAA